MCSLWACSRWVSCDASHVGTIFFLQTVARAGEGDGHGAGRGVEQARNFGILFSFEKPEGKHLSDFRIEAGEGAAQPVADLAGGASALGPAVRRLGEHGFELVQ